MTTRTLTISIEVSDSEYEYLVNLADTKDYSVESLLVDCIGHTFGLTGN